MAATGDRSSHELLASVALAELLTNLSGPPMGMRTSARWRCPATDHPDRHPSVTIHRGGDGIERWRCWSGGHGGTAIDALMVARGFTVSQAMQQLRLQCGIHVRDSSTVDRSRDGLPAERHPAVVQYVEACERIAASRTGREVIEWLVDVRRLDRDVLRTNRVGADPGPELFRRRSGLPRGGRAAVFPALDGDGAVGYVQVRYLEPAEGQGKYDNPSARMGPNPRVGFVRPTSADRGGVLVVCEGLLDAYVAAGAGFEAVGVLGAGFPDRRVVDAISDAAGARHVVVAFDNDDAGRRGSQSLTRSLSDRGHSVSALELPSGVNDLADWARLDARWHAAVTGPHRGGPTVSLDRDVAVPGVAVPGVG